jgi:hypothetical protein
VRYWDPWFGTGAMMVRRLLGSISQGISDQIDSFSNDYRRTNLLPKSLSYGLARHHHPPREDWITGAHHVGGAAPDQHRLSYPSVYVERARFDASEDWAESEQKLECLDGEGVEQETTAGSARQLFTVESAFMMGKHFDLSPERLRPYIQASIALAYQWYLSAANIHRGPLFKHHSELNSASQSSRPRDSQRQAFPHCALAPALLQLKARFLSSFHVFHVTHTTRFTAVPIPFRFRVRRRQ